MDYQLWLGDCLEQMDRIEAGSVDAIIADWPYQQTACSWDSMIPLEPLWKQCKRVIKPNRAIVLFGNEPFTSLLIVSNLKWFKYRWTWDKRKASNCLNGNKQPLRRVEDIAVFYKQQCTYNPQKIANPKGLERRSLYAYNRSNEFGETTGKVRQGGVSLGYEADKLLPVDILEFAKPARPIHPTQKPVKLLEFLIKTYTNEGETVLDSTMGSGSTGEACLRTGRRFIGIEKDAGYFEIASQRLGRVAAELRGELNHLPMFQEPVLSSIEGAIAI